MKGNSVKQKKNKAASKGTNDAKAGKQKGLEKGVKKTPSHSQQQSSKGPSSSHEIGRVYYIFAVISFLVGIYTPPLYTGIVNYSNGTISDLLPGISSSSSLNRWLNIPTKNDGRRNDKPSSSYVECNPDNLSQYLHDEPMKGLHILCFPFQKVGKGNDLEVTFYKHAYNDTNAIHQYSIDTSDPSNSFDNLKYVLDTKLEVEMYNFELSMKQPWAIYSMNGERLVHEFHMDGDYENESSITDAIDILQTHGMVLLFEGGTWLWPGVRVGFQRTIEIHDRGSDSQNNNNNNSKRNITIETLSLYPLVLSVPDFIYEEECTHVQNKAEPSMQYSSVTLMDKDKGRPASDFRTSQSAFLPAYSDEIMMALEYRTASLTRLPRSHQEYTQVLRYGYEEKYSAHLDWFDKSAYLQDKHTLKLIDHGRKNRLATVFWYLSDVEEGGHTVFPRFGKAPQPYDVDDCTHGLLVKPQRGKVIVFYSLTADGKGDPLSLHGACKVKEGIKWAANKWVWNTPMGFVND